MLPPRNLTKCFGTTLSTLLANFLPAAPINGPAISPATPIIAPSLPSCNIPAIV